MSKILKGFFLSFRIFGLLFSPLLLYSQRFGLLQMICVKLGRLHGT